ncbi:MAG: GNAT family N-acetyltransferase, partial [Eggerthellaceae bacterium]|nr:GNAT family N-acetyltransferase [Eggerthellaceae bacterium]
VMLSFGHEPYYDFIDGGEWLTDANPANPGYAVIHRVAVDSSSKSCGAASFALKSVIDLAFRNNADSIRVDTHPDNLPMRHLLEKHGFTHCGTVYCGHIPGKIASHAAYERKTDGRGLVAAKDAPCEWKM